MFDFGFDFDFGQRPRTGRYKVYYEPFTWVRYLENGKGRFAENTSPHPRVKTPRLNRMVHQLNPPLTSYSKDEVSYEPSPWVTSLKGGQDIS